MSDAAPTPDARDWQRLQDVFRIAAALPEPQRAAYLNRACDGDSEFRRRVDGLLGTHDRTDGVLDSPLVDNEALSTPVGGADGFDVVRQALRGTIGEFHIVKLIGQGGMGAVYEAQQHHPRRTAALKVLRPGLASARAVRRLEFEADVLARLRHSAIAQILQAGTFQINGEPQPYFAMELVEGVPITEFAQKHQLGARERMELLMRVCEGVEYAHSQGVVHRDLKPSNILVEDRECLEASRHHGSKPTHSARGQPKILDFGIARVSDSAATMRTEAGQLLGTLAYMSPEQMAGDLLNIDARCDVYALGVIAYELLAEQLPHDVQSSPLPEIVRAIREDEPPMLSSINQAYRGDLELIIARALEKEPSRRYQGVAEFADDLEHYLNDEPVSAHPATMSYRLRKFVRRNRALVIGVAAVFLALLCGVIGTTVGLIRADLAAAEQERLRIVADKAAAESKSAAIAAQDRFARMQAMSWQLLSVAGGVLSETPGGIKASEDLARMALEGLQQFRDDGTDERTSAYLESRLQQVVEEAQLAMGRSAEALLTQQAALDAVSAFAQANPTDAAALLSLAVTHWKVAEVHLVQGRLDEARLTVMQSLRLLRENATLQQENVHHYLGAAHRRMGEIEAQAGDARAAIEHYRQSVGHFDRALESLPVNVPSQQGLAMTLRLTSKLLLTLDNPAEAMAAIERNRSIVADLAQRAGATDLWTRLERARSLVVRAHIHQALGESHEAAVASDEAVALSQSTSSLDPLNMEARRLLAQCLFALGEIEAQQHKELASVTHVDQGIEMMEDVVQRDPTNTLARRELEKWKELRSARGP
jgi:serine/threonine protein kinase